VLFGAITLAVFWNFIFRGHTFLATAVLEDHFERPEQEPPAWFKPPRPHWRIIDTVMLLPTHYGVYNEGLKAGELRLWNPYLLCGLPIYSDPMVHPFYPPNLLLHRIFSPDAAYGLALLLHFFFSGAAMFWALRTMGRSQAAATLGGVVWMLLGYHAMWFSTAILLGASVFGPLALAAVSKGLEKKDLRLAAWAGLAMGMILMGSHPQHAAHCFIFMAGWLVCAWVRDREGRPFVARFSSLFAVLSIGTGLAAILTRLDSIAFGNRVTGPDLETLYGRPLGLITHLAGLVLGKVYYPADMLLEYEFTLYAGLAATGLALTGAVRGFREPATRYVAIFGAAAFLVAFVKPLALLAGSLPLLKLSPPSRWVYLGGFALAILSARGADALTANPGGAARWACGAAALLALPGFWIPGAVETMIGFALAAAAALALRRRPRAALALCLGALLWDLLPFFRHFNFAVDRRIVSEVPEPIRFALERDPGPWRATGSAGQGFTTPHRELSSELIVGNSVLSLHRVESPAGFDAIIPSVYAEFSRKAGATVEATGRVIAWKNFASPLLDVAGLKYVFMPYEIRMPERFTLVKQWDRVRLYENGAALPRAWLSPGPIDGETPSRIDAPVEWVERGTDRARLDVTAPRAAWLVVSDTFYPGWEATVDGRPVPIRTAHAAFRAVEIPEGRHAIEFRFRPASARFGMIGSILFTIVALAFALLRRAS
jgi:hypothetical protein